MRAAGTETRPEIREQKKDFQIEADLLLGEHAFQEYVGKDPQTPPPANIPILMYLRTLYCPFPSPLSQLSF